MLPALALMRRRAVVDQLENRPVALGTRFFLRFDAFSHASAGEEQRELDTLARFFFHEALARQSERAQAIEKKKIFLWKKKKKSRRATTKKEKKKKTLHFLSFTLFLFFDRFFSLSLSPSLRNIDNRHVSPATAANKAQARRRLGPGTGDRPRRLVGSREFFVFWFCFSKKKKKGGDNPH